MKTPIQRLRERLEQCALQGRRAVRIEQELQKDPEGALRIVRATMRGALREVEELLDDDIPVGKVGSGFPF